MKTPLVFLPRSPCSARREARDACPLGERAVGPFVSRSLGPRVTVTQSPLLTQPPTAT